MLRLVSKAPEVPDATSERSAEAKLVERCRAGERAAWDELYRTHRRLVAGNLYRVLGERSELDDLVQEVFVIAVRGLDRFRGDAKLTTWLYRICVNVALGKLRTRSRKPPPLPLDPDRERGDDGEGSPERAMLRREEQQRVYAALDTLAPKKRVVFVLHEIEGLEPTEIAQIVQAPVVTVRTRLHYARKEFYKKITEGGR